MNDEELSRIIGEAIGEASMCWSEYPKGVFASDRAKGIVDQLLSLIKSNRIEWVDNKISKLLDEFANTPLDKRGTGWDWLVSLRQILKNAEKEGK